MSNAQIVLEIDRIVPLIAERMRQFTQEDWDEVLVRAYKLTAELKVALANEVNGGPDHVLALCRVRE